MSSLVKASKVDVSNEQIKKELDEWTRVSSSEIKLLGISRNILNFEGGDQKYRLTVPESYPEKDSGIIVIDYDSMEDGNDFICGVNEYFIDKRPNLLRILKHIDRKYKKMLPKLKTMKSTDYQTSYDYNLDKFEEEEKLLENFDIEEIKLRSHLEKKLDSMKSSLTPDGNSNKAPVLFTGTLPGTILINQFMEMRSVFNKSSTIHIDLIDDNIYEWKVTFRDFSNKELTASLNSLKEQYGYDFIEIHINFHDKMYPGYPPFVKVIRPRLGNSLMHRITNMKMVQLEYWNPCRTIEFIISKLYTVLNKHGVVENNLMNSMDKKGGSYHELEEILIKLASLCDVKDVFEPLDTEEYVKVYDFVTSTTNKKKYSTSTNKKENSGWKPGTGYGHSGLNTWDINKYIQLQQEKDSQIQTILQKIINTIETSSDEDMHTIYNIFESSYMIPFFKSHLQGITILEIGKHSQLYRFIFTLLQYLATEESIYLLDDKNGNKTLFDLLSNLNTEAQQVIKITGTETGTDDDNDGNVDLNIASMVTFLFEMIEPCFKSYQETIKKYQDNKKEKLRHKMEKAVKTLNPIHLEYKEVMEKLRFDMLSFVKNGFHYNPSSSTNRKVSRRLASEYSSFSSSLPIFFQSSIFVRVDETNIRCMRVLITGPEDTPYDSGVFLFDVYIEDTYPNGPPKMNLVNHGKIRFNPNLYNCGKVCLSLLGTWSGSGGEQWNKNTSTLQQLFVSVQSQILIDSPIFNEPGHEKEYGTPSGDNKNKKYNQYVRYYNMCHAIHDILTNIEKYPEFKDVIRNHFILKKDYILKVCKKWMDESFDLSSSMQHDRTLNKSMFEQKYKQIKEELEKLE